MNQKRNIFCIDKQSNLLWCEDYPLSSKYDADWIFEHEMGPNPLWFVEWLSRDMVLKPGMRILDLGCGMVISSIFLAKEFEVQVWATDLWIDANDNAKRIREVGLENLIFPVHAEAHNLPYTEGFFDAIISVDCYQYFGTDQLYLGYLHKFVKPDGEIGIVTPGLHHELGSDIPNHLTREQKSGGIFWTWEMCVFHTAEWWQTHWELCPFIETVISNALADGGHLWLFWEKAMDASGRKRRFPSDAEVMEADDNKNLTFIRVIGRRK